jgi:hypothetical protein
VGQAASRFFQRVTGFPSGGKGLKRSEKLDVPVDWSKEQVTPLGRTRDGEGCLLGHGQGRPGCHPATSSHQTPQYALPQILTPQPAMKAMSRGGRPWRGDPRLPEGVIALRQGGGQGAADQRGMATGNGIHWQSEPRRCLKARPGHAARGPRTRIMKRPGQQARQARPEPTRKWPTLPGIVTTPRVSVPPVPNAASLPGRRASAAHCPRCQERPPGPETQSGSCPPRSRRR